MNKLPISVCMLVKDEEDRLVKSLPPLAIFKEVLIYDSGSTDGSIELCKKHDAQIIHGSWHGFAETRRKLFSQANQPWILWLDADEVITPKLLEELRTVFDENIEVSGFEVNRMVFFEGKWIRHGDWFPDWNLRLFRTDSWQMDDREVHESIKVCGSSSRLDGLLKHYSYRNWQDRKLRMERYSRLWADMKFREGRAIKPFEAWLRAIWRFLRGYFLKFGFLDGSTGFRIAVSNSREVYQKYKMLSSMK